MKRQRPYGYWLAGAAIVLVYVVLRINLIDIPFDRDEGIFGYIGRTILDNGLPYRDAFEHKPPLVFYINALALLMVPPTPAGIHLFLHAYNFLTLVSISLVSRVYFRSASAGLWTAFIYAVFSASPAIQGFSASTEMFMLLPVSVCLLMVLLAVERQNLFLAAASGLAGATACWIKQIAFFVIAFSALYMLVAQRSLPRNTGGRSTTVSRLLFAWAGGALSISIFIGVYFGVHGVFDEFVYWSFTHNILYSQSIDAVQKRALFFAKMKEIFSGDFIPIIAGILFGAIQAIKRQKQGLFVLGLLAVSFLGTIPGFAYSHYFALLAPAVAVAAGAAFAFFPDASRGARVLVLLACTAAVIAPPLVVNGKFFFERSPEKISRDYFHDNPFPESRPLAEYVRQHTGPEDRIFIFGSEPQIFLYAGRKSAIPFITIYPLTNTFPRNREFQESAWASIDHRHPAYILIVDNAFSIFWDGKVEMSLLDRTTRLIKEAYHLDAVMLIGGEQGRLILDSPSKENLANDRGVDAIYVYRRNEDG